VALGLWFVVGLLLDVWAHNNLRGLESFFTPWHAVFYSGFAATATWMCWLVWRGRDTHGLTRAAVPVGYGAGIVALPMFALAGVADLVWHTVFGVEQSLRILFSPSHLALITAMVLIVTSPLRSAWANADLPTRPRLRRLVPAIVGLSFGATLVMLLLQYANALVWSPRAIVVALSNPLDGTVELTANPAELASAVAVTNVVLLAPLLILARRWSPPPGTATILFTTLGALAAAITAFDNVAIVAGVIVSGIVADLLLAWLRPGASDGGPRPNHRAAYLAFAGLTPLVFWALYLAAASWETGRLPAVAEYWTGLPVAAGLMGVLLAVIAAPSSGDPEPGPEAARES